MLNTPETLEWVRQLFDDPTKEVIFHNAKFDLLMFLNEGIDIFEMQAKAHCTLILSKLRNENGQHDLMWLSAHLLGRDTEDKTEITDWIKSHKRDFVKEHGRDPNYTDAPIDLVKRRNLWDSESTLYLFLKLWRTVGSDIHPDLYEQERKLMFVVVGMENTGHRVDISKARELKSQALADTQKLIRDIREIVGEITIRRARCSCNGKKKGKVIKAPILDPDEVVICEYCGEQCRIDEEIIRKRAFNPGSDALQLPTAFTKIGIELKYKTVPKKGKKGGEKKGGGRWSFDEYAMIRYVAKPIASIIRDSGEEGWTTERFYNAVYAAVEKYDLDPRRDVLPPLILKYRELTKMVNTYYNHIIEESVDRLVEPNGRETGILHGSFNQSEAMTGRFSCSEPNLQNMPRLLGPRQCFINRIGTDLWYFDYEQAEMRFFAHFSEDDDIIAAIRGDIHLNMASKIYGIPTEQVTSEQRKRVKAINFGILYGAGPAKMADTLTRRGIPTSTTEAATIVAEYHRRFPSIRRLTNRLAIQLAHDKYIENPFGRRYHIPARAAYKALNYMCQGSSADLMKRAMVRVWRWLRRHKLMSRILLTVHDELCIEIPPVERWIVPKIHDLMADRESFYVPMEVGVEMAPKRWSEKFDVELKRNELHVMKDKHNLLRKLQLTPLGVN